MTGMMRVPRSRGALSGVLLVLLGAWGGLVPFIGPHFHYAFTPDSSWTYTSGRLWLEILPGAAAVLGGLIVLSSRFRPMAMLGAWLAALSGAWFAVGGILSLLWTTGGAAGHAVGGTATRVAEQIGFFTGLGVVIAFLAALALGRFSVVGVREVRMVTREREALAAEQAAGHEPAVPVASTAGDRVADEPVVTREPVVAREPVVTREPVVADEPAVAADEPAAEPAAASSVSTDTPVTTTPPVTAVHGTTMADGTVLPDKAIAREDEEDAAAPDKVTAAP
jgi:hypothetical protein